MKKKERESAQSEQFTANRNSEKNKKKRKLEYFKQRENLHIQNKHDWHY